MKLNFLSMSKPKVHSNIIKGNAQFIFLCNPQKSLVNVKMKIS